jgi:hypothetical protein
MDEYDAMVDEFAFTVVDATRNVHAQQEEVRALIEQRFDLTKHQSRVEWPTNGSIPSLRPASSQTS